MTKENDKKRQSAEGRKAAGLVRIDVWIPVDAAADLEVLCQLESETSDFPLVRCRTIAITNAIRLARAHSRRPRGFDPDEQ